jgi:MFS family permease
MYRIAGVFAVLEVYPFLLAMRGELGGPGILALPSESKADGAAKDSLAKAKEPEKAATKLRTSMTFWQIWFHRAASPFVGFGMKSLTTSIFQIAYDTSFMSSSYLTALSMCSFVAAQGAFPLLAKRLPVVGLNSGMMLASAVLYATYPTIVVTSPIWVLLLAKLVTAGNFGGTLSLHNQLLIDMFGASELGTVNAALGSANCVGFGLGPVIGHYLQRIAVELGHDPVLSFRPWFYTCSLVAAVDAMNLICMRMRSSRKGATGSSKGEQPIEDIFPQEVQAEWWSPEAAHARQKWGPESTTAPESLAHARQKCGLESAVIPCYEPV